MLLTTSNRNILFLILCSVEEWMLYRFRTTWGSIIDDIIFLTSIIYFVNQPYQKRSVRSAQKPLHTRKILDSYFSFFLLFKETVIEETEMDMCVPHKFSVAIDCVCFGASQYSFSCQISCFRLQSVFLPKLQMSCTECVWAPGINILKIGLAGLDGKSGVSRTTRFSVLQPHCFTLLSLHLPHNLP